MSKDPLSSTTQTWYARQRRHHHNSFQGHCAMSRMQMQAIQQSDTATLEAKELAGQIARRLVELAELLKERVDP